MQISKFTEDFKLKAIKLTSNKSVVDAAKEMGCSISSLYNWRRENAKIERKLKGATSAKPEIYTTNAIQIELLKTNEQLREEIKALKVILKSILN